VAFGVLLAIASIAVLIYFIHHIATSIRIETLLAQLAAETAAAIDRLYPERLGRDLPASEELRPSTSPERLRERGRVRARDEERLRPAPRRGSADAARRRA
jgi:uncharacterized membrane protein